MVDIILKIILLLAPIYYCFNVHPNIMELFFYQISCMVLFIASFLDKPKREFNIRQFAVAFVGIFLFALVNHAKTNLGMYENIGYLANVFFGISALYTISVYCRDWKKCIDFLVIGLSINLLVFFAQTLGWHPIITSLPMDANNNIVNEFGGIAGNSTRLGYFLALITPFISFIPLVFVAAMGIVLKEILVTVCAIAMIFLGTKNIIIRISIAILSILGLYSLYHQIGQSFNFRLGIWKQAIEEICKRPVIGYGIGNFKIAEYCFSPFIQWIHGVGVIGLAFIVLCLRKINILLVPLFILCLFEYPFEVKRLWPVIIFILAVYSIEQKKEVRLC